MEPIFNNKAVKSLFKAPIGQKSTPPPPPPPPYRSIRLSHSIFKRLTFRLSRLKWNITHILGCRCPRPSFLSVLLPLLLLAVLPDSRVKAQTTPQHEFSIGLSANSAAEGNSGSSIVATGTVSISNALTFPVSLSLCFAGTATRGTDYTVIASNTTDKLTFQTSSVNNCDSDTYFLTPLFASASSLQFRIQVSGDATIENDEAITISIVSVSTSTEEQAKKVGISPTAGSATFTIEDDDSPTATFAAATSSADEDDGTVTVAVNLSANATMNTDVVYSVSGTATSATDFTALSGTVQITSGTNTANISIPITDDTTDEPSETLILTLNNSLGYQVGTTSVHTLTVSDNDATTSAVTGTTAAVTEGSTKTFTVSIGRALRAGESLRMPLAFTGTATQGTDYMTACPSSLPTGVTCANLNSSNAAVNFNGSDAGSATSVTLTLTATADNNAESGGETVNINPSTPTASGLDGGAAPTTDSFGEFRINDPPPAAPTGLTATAGDRQVTLSWMNPNNSNITGYQFRTRTDRQFGWANISGSTAATTTHTVTRLTNGVVHVFQIRAVAGTVNGDPSDEVTVTPVAPEITITAGTAVTEGAAVSFTISASPVPASNLTVNLNIADAVGSDFVASDDEGMKMVMIPASSGSVTYTVATINDNIDEPNGSVTVTVANGTGYTVGTPSEASVTVNDDEAPVVPEITVTAGTSPVTEGTAASFTLTATPALAADLTVNLSVAEAAGSDFIASGDEGPKTVTIPAASGSVTYTVATVNDDIDEPNGSVTVTVANGTGYTVGISASAMVVVNDDDEAAPVVPEITVTAGTSPVTEGTAASFTVMAAPAPESNLTVNLSVTEAAGSDFVASDSEGMKTVAIPAAAGNVTVTYTVATVNDDTDEPNGSVTVTVANGTGYAVGTPSEATVTVNDDDDDEEAPLGADDATETVIFPNPSGRYLEVRSLTGGTFQILSLSGKPLLKGTTNTRVDITSLQSGLYLVQLPDGRLLKFVRE